MGLDTTHNCWHGAYSAFNRWRNHVAQAAGYAVEGRNVLIDWGHVTEANLQGDWKQIPHGLDGPDPLIILIAHSDCDGTIRTEHAGPLAERLEDLLPKIQDEDGGGHVAASGGYRQVTYNWINGLREASDLGEDVEFH